MNLILGSVLSVLVLRLRMPGMIVWGKGAPDGSTKRMLLTVNEVGDAGFDKSSKLIVAKSVLAERVTGEGVCRVKKTRILAGRGLVKLVKAWFESPVSSEMRSAE